MTLKFSSSLKATILPLVLVSLVSIFFMNCKTDVSSKKQQSAFYVDADGNLMNKKGKLVKNAGEYKMEGGYYVDMNGERIKRNIDKTKEKINEKVGATKEKLSDAASSTKEAMSNAASNTKEAMSNAASLTAAGVKDNFNKLFNTKAVGTAYALHDIAFDKESHRITGMSKEEVEGLAAALKEHPESRIQVQVHTSDGKNKAKCKKISSLRADVVKNMLVTLGVNADQISAKGLGLTATDAAKAVANTVEVVVEE